MKRRNRKGHRLLSLALCFLMVFALLPTAVFAAEYSYQYPAEKPYHEMSMYAYKINAADAESYPTGVFRLLADDHRTRYAYCADSEIYDVPGTAYQAVSLSDYYGETAASTGKLRAIIQNAYPFIGMNEMISRVEQSGVSLHAASVPCYEMVLISAIQQAIYFHTNPNIAIEVRFAGGFSKNVYETYQPFIDQYNDGYNDKQVTQAYPHIKADVEAVFRWLCSLSSADAPHIPDTSVSFAAEVEQASAGDFLILYDLFDGFENCKERLHVSVAEIVGTNENLIFEKPFNEFVSVGEGRYTTKLPDTISGNSLKVTLNGYRDYEDVVIYEAEKTESETSQPFIGYGKICVPFSKTEQIDMPAKTGTLLIQKTVSGEGADPAQNFLFTVTLKQNGDVLTGNAIYGGVAFVNGVATFVLKHNESKKIEGLPAGIAYFVEESDNSGYVVTKTNETGSIVAETMVEAIFENHKPGGGGHADLGTTSLSVNKIWKGGDVATRPRNAFVQLYCNGKAHGNIVVLNESNHWRYTWNHLDEDRIWTVDEVNVPRGYTRSLACNDNVWTITNTKTQDNVLQTGENSSVAQWIAFACLSATGFLATLCSRKHRNRRREES